MTNIKDIYCLDINWLDKEIRDLREEIILSESLRDIPRAGIESFQLETLLQVKNKLNPIEPMVRGVLDDDRDYRLSTSRKHGVAYKNDEHYINTKQFKL